jgi:glycosyltransferase involved in cell wall biosynthesis
VVPTVSILLPVFNEAVAVESCLASLQAQDYPAIVEILIAEGGSNDGTQDILTAAAAQDPRVRVIANPDRLQSHGLNRLVAVARGGIAVRADAHTDYARDYVSRCVAALAESDAELVGGPMLPEGSTPMERAVAAAMTSPVAVGGAAFRRRGAAGAVDTVYLGACETETLRRHGGYRHLPSGVAEDADLAYRIRKAGGRVWLDPAIRSTYRPRSTLGALWRQFRRYGIGKAEMLYLNGEFPSWRPMAPLLLIAALIGGTALGVAGVSWWPLLGIVAAWIAALGVGAIGAENPGRTAAAIATMHSGYGIGLATGLLLGPSSVSAVGSATPAADPPADDLDRNPQDG